MANPTRTPAEWERIRYEEWRAWIEQRYEDQIFEAWKRYRYWLLTVLPGHGTIE